jgi:SAM-dependent methyltransferase
VTDLRGVLDTAFVYDLFRALVSHKRGRGLIARYIQAGPGARVLDIGCGPASVRSDLPDVDYVGLDDNPRYLAAARRKFGDRVTLFRARLGHDVILDLGKFDVVFAVGVLHHLTDDEAVALFEVAKSALRPLGHFVSVDPCWAGGQSWLARAFIALDRGRFVRTADGYSALGARVFRTCTAELRHDLLRIPYTHLILSCRP